jgi:hypothetical protein
VIRDVGNRTGFVRLCLFGDLPVIVLISFELTLLDSLIADEDDRFRHFDFLSEALIMINLKARWVSLFIDFRLDKLLDGFVAFLDGALHHTRR